MDSAPKMRVAICGGGVAGFILASALSRYPEKIQVDIYEAAALFDEIGAGIGMWPRTWKIMKALGLDEGLSEVSIIPPENIPKVAFDFRKGDQSQGVTFHQMVTPGGLISFHRPAFQSVLLRHFGTLCRTHNSKRLLSYSRDSSNPLSPIRLEFQDGSCATCDLLIGADGLKSAVRVAMLRERAYRAEAEGDMSTAKAALENAHAKWSGTMAYRLTVEAAVLAKRFPDHRVLTSPTVYFGKNTQITAYPIAKGKLVNVAAFRASYDRENTSIDFPWVQTVPREELLRDFDEWEPEIQAILDCIQKPSRWAVHTTGPLQSFVSDRVALVGDAAHAMMPYQGSGAGQAVEDAYVLALLLGHPKTTLSTLQRALEIYDTVRRPFSQYVADVSRENGLLYTLNYPGFALDRPVSEGDEQQQQLLSEMCTRITNNWKWAWDTTVDNDAERALEMMGGEGGENGYH